MSMGFQLNGVPLKPSSGDHVSDVDFAKMWEDRLNLSSVEVREAYEQYGRSYRR